MEGADFPHIVPRKVNTFRGMGMESDQPETKSKKNVTKQQHFQQFSLCLAITFRVPYQMPESYHFPGYGTWKLIRMSHQEADFLV